MAPSSVRNLGVLGLLGALVLVSSTACTSSTGNDTEHLSRASTAIIGGQPSPAAENFVVHVLGADVACSGTLIAPNIVLTARHCLTTDTIGVGEFRCVLGTDIIGPETLRVFVGPTEATGRNVAVKRIIVDFDSTSCADDIAALVLAEDITEVAPPPVELDTEPQIGAPCTMIGWGAVSDDPLTAKTTVRQREEGTVLGVSAGTYPTQGASRFIDIPFVMTSQSMCSGDSGGTLLDKRGALIAVIIYYLTADAAGTNCTGTVSGSVGLYRHAEFVERVMQSIGKMPTRAGKPPPADIGGACTINNECNSNYCIGLGPKSVCSKICKADADCGTLSCVDGGQGFNVCMDATTQPTSKASCAASPADSSPTGTTAVLAGLGMLSLASRRRRRR